MKIKDISHFQKAVDKRAFKTITVRVTPKMHDFIKAQNIDLNLVIHDTLYPYLRHYEKQGGD